MCAPPAFVAGTPTAFSALANIAALREQARSSFNETPESKGVAHFAEHGAFYPVGGSAAIADSLLRTVIDAGGHVRINADVREILVARAVLAVGALGAVFALERAILPPDQATRGAYKLILSAGFLVVAMAMLGELRDRALLRKEGPWPGSPSGGKRKTAGAGT